ncbi:MAG: hypothetical protein ABJZ55_02020 [Fuerstiella sp.]
MFNWTNRFQALETLLVGLTGWQSWVDSADESVLRSRITYPLRSAGLFEYPYINFSPGKALSQSVTGGYESSANFQTSGTLCLRLWDSDSNTADPAASFAVFDGKATTLLNELIAAGQDGPLILTAFEGDEPDIVHSHDEAFILGEQATSDAVWLGSVNISWGLY